jgi:hypothetical protein
LIGIGNKYGNVASKDIMPSRKTVAKTCIGEAETNFVKTVNAYMKLWQGVIKKNFVAMIVYMLECGR